MQNYIIIFIIIILLFIFSGDKNLIKKFLNNKLLFFIVLVYFVFNEINLIFVLIVLIAVILMNENIRTILFGKYKKQISSIKDLFKNSGYFDNLVVDIDEQPDDPITSIENSEDLTNLEPDQPNENIDSEINENENFQKLLKEVDMEG